MNTTLKGDSFEQRIRNVISSLIEKSVGYPKENFWIEPILAEFGNK